MRTANRKPKVRKVPSKGAKTYLKQGLKALKKTIALASGPTNKDQNWFTPKAVRAQWLASFTGNHSPHQGAKEKARRCRQMIAHKCINPETWKHYV